MNNDSVFPSKWIERKIAMTYSEYKLTQTFSFQNFAHVFVQISFYFIYDSEKNTVLHCNVTMVSFSVLWSKAPSLYSQPPLTQKWVEMCFPLWRENIVGFIVKLSHKCYWHEVCFFGLFEGGTVGSQIHLHHFFIEIDVALEWGTPLISFHKVFNSERS